MRVVILTGGVPAAAGMKAELVGSPAELVSALDRAPADLVLVQALRFLMLGNEKYAPYRAE